MLKNKRFFLQLNAIAMLAESHIDEQILEDKPITSADSKNCIQK